MLASTLASAGSGTSISGTMLPVAEASASGDVGTSVLGEVSGSGTMNVSSFCFQGHDLILLVVYLAEPCGETLLGLTERPNHRI